MRRCRCINVLYSPAVWACFVSRRSVNFTDDVPLLLLVSLHSVVAAVEPQPREKLLREGVNGSRRFPPSHTVVLLKLGKTPELEVGNVSPALDPLPFHFGFLPRRGAVLAQNS